MPDTRPTQDIRNALIDAALLHVPFDGWSEASFSAACVDADIAPELAEAIFPRRHVDLAVGFHRRCDAEMAERLQAADLGALRFRDRVAQAVRFRLEAAGDKEAVRRGATLFSLPQHGPEGARLIWDTADLIWQTLGDTSDDINWYTKRATLSGVYGSTVLYWLGDTSEGDADTWAFLERRIDDVMKIEEVKAAVEKNPLLKAAFAGPTWLMRQVRAPSTSQKNGLPGLMPPK